MEQIELMKIAVKMVNKGYIDIDKIRYCDDLYKATGEEIEDCLDYVSEIIDDGMRNFLANNNLNN